MSEAKERPIIFSGPMVRAILAGRKTQTRRVAKGFSHKCPYGNIGDMLWAREAYNPGLIPERSRADGYLGCVYRADDFSASYSGGWTPSIHMPRRHSRITLEIVSVRVERLQDISENDAKSEGVPPNCLPDLGNTWATYRQGFIMAWDTINAKRGYSWDSNPWVWVVQFKVLHASQQPHAVDLASAPLRPNH